MSKIQLKRPVNITRAEQPFDILQKSWRGMLQAPPGSGIPVGYSEKSVNVNNYRTWAEGRPGSRLYTDVATPSGDLNARADHENMGLVIWQYGSTVYVTDKPITTYTPVENFSSTAVSDTDGDIAVYEKEAYLFSGDAIYRIVLDESFYYMYRINEGVPTTLITGVPEDSSKIYGYRYTYSLSRFPFSDYTGNRADGTSELLWESGTCQEIDSVDYGDVFRATEISPTATDTPVGNIEVPAGNYSASSASIYRTKNIGTKGAEPGRVFSAGQWIGNRVDQVVWVDDVPVAKVMMVSVNPAGPPYAVSPILGSVGFDAPDRGAAIKDINGLVGSIQSVGPDLVTGITTGNNAIAIGGGRIGMANISGGILDKVSGPALEVFEATDVGKPIFFHTGAYTHITGYVSPTRVTIADTSISGVPIAYTLGVADTAVGKTYEFQRTYFDVLPDVVTDGSSSPSIDARINSESDLYIPARFFNAMVGGDRGVIDSGFMFACNRNDDEARYSQLTNIFRAGYYRRDIQYFKTHQRVVHMEAFAGNFSVFHPNETYGTSLQTVVNAGNKDIGEFVARIDDLTVYDGDIGIIFWESFQRVRSNLIFGLTSEFSFRTYDGRKWGTTDYAVDSSTSLSAIKKILDRMDPFYRCVSTYSKEDGYILWFWTNEEACDDVVQDNGGTELSGSDIWNDNGGTAITGDDVVQDVGGQVCEE